jgi:GNAT superfamily N-acetyltransferase
MSLPGNFHQALTAAYRKNPCQVLPNALWKSLSWAEHFETDFEIEAGTVTQLMAWNRKQLMLYWSRDRRLRDWPVKNSQSIEFALLHRDYESALDPVDFEQRYLSFRLLHHMEVIPAPVLPTAFSFTPVDPISEAQEISAFIGACYEDIHPAAEVVRGWATHPVFAADLWVWIIDVTRDAPAALGIAEFDSTIAEGLLEWIQVLPEYRRNGLGKQLVFELLARLQNRAMFTTVAGRVDNITRPDKLYRRCGFEGDDTWWVLQAGTKDL